MCKSVMLYYTFFLSSRSLQIEKNICLSHRVKALGKLKRHTIRTILQNEIRCSHYKTTVGIE